MFIRSSGPVIASKPVANTMTSSLYSVRSHVDQRDIVAVVGLEIVGVDRRGLGCVGVIDVGQFRCCDRVFYYRANLGADKLRGSIVSRLIQQDVLEGGAETQAAAFPGFLKYLAFFRRDF